MNKKLYIFFFLISLNFIAYGMKVYQPTDFTDNLITNVSSGFAVTGVFKYVPEASSTEPVPYWQMTNYVSDLGTSSITTNKIFQINDDGVDIVKLGFFQGYLTTNKDVGGTAEYLKFEAETRNDTNYYSHSNTTNPEEVTIKKTGWYKISYEVCWFQNPGDNGRHIMHTWVVNNGSEIIPSSSYSYTRDDNYGQYNSCVATFIFEVTMPDSKVKLAAQRVSGSYDPQALSDKSWILIEKI
jgi:hypothetical protein